MTQELIQIKHLRDYTKCSNYAKYNWHSPNPSNQSITRSILQSCYRDAAILNKRTDWKTIRNRVYKEVFKEPNKTTDQLYRESLVVLETLRNWYLQYYRDVPGDVLCNLTLSDNISGLQISAQVDAVLVQNDIVTLIDFNEINNIEDILKDIGIRTKIYLLGKEKLLVSKVICIKATDKTISCNTLSIHNPVEWNFKTQQALGMMLLSIKQNIYYPSPTSMCTTCPYKGVCSW